MAKGPPEKECCREALLASLMYFGGDFSRETAINISFHRAARLAYSLVKMISGGAVRWEQIREPFLYRRKIYRIFIPESGKMQDFMARWGIPDGLSRSRLRKSCCQRAFLRGAFLVGGSINSPNRFYHFEIVSPSQEAAAVIVKILSRMEISARISERRGNPVVYVKKAEDIANLLNIMGAHRSLLKFEEIRAIKATKEEVRRMVNCETANLDKTSQAAVRQVLKIRHLKEVGALGRLSKGLREIADLRIRFPEASLRELGERMNPPLSKSSVNSRLRRLEAITFENNKGNNA